MKMNMKKLILAAASLTAAGYVFAAGPAGQIDQGASAAPKTRAQVQAELEKAYADGSWPSPNAEFVDEFAVAKNRKHRAMQREAAQAGNSQPKGGQ
jgi:hypothetical protein